eukprot:4745917-Prymnesium_polylepis.1
MSGFAARAAARARRAGRLAARGESHLDLLAARAASAQLLLHQWHGEALNVAPTLNAPQVVLLLLGACACQPALADGLDGRCAQT